MNLIETSNLIFEYIKRDKDGNPDGVTRAVDGVSLDVKQGDFIAILGHNGSGKSTFAKHLNAILHPTDGVVYVDGMDVSDEEKTWDVRKTCGMVFQNPDNQIIGSLVEEDVGFGPENMGVPTDEIWQRVVESLKCVGMYEYRNKAPNRLSGGQKQRVTIAGVLAMHPKCIVLDEPTAMLDPVGRREVLDAVRALNDVENITIILITHNMDEAVFADRVYVMDKGSVVLEGTPAQVFSHADRLNELRLSIPEAAKLSAELNKRGISLPSSVLTEDELVKAVLEYRGPVAYKSAGTYNHAEQDTNIHVYNFSETYSAVSSDNHNHHNVTVGGNSVKGSANNSAQGLIINHLSHIYGDGTAFYSKSLDDITLKIPEGQFIGIIGQTGSGKSTLVQHLDGILKPTSGEIYYNGEDISDADFDMKMLRSRVGLVFQYPEHQLFEVDVFSDVCFGPKNLGLEQKEVQLRAYDALKAVGISDENFYVSPFDLSGGEKRRVAIAGVLAMKPDILILDEPTAGLDPLGQKEILTLIKSLHDTHGITILLVSHSMEDVAEYADRIIVLHKGKIALDGTPSHVFSHYSELNDIGLSTPFANRVLHRLHNMGLNVNTSAITVKDAADAIAAALAGKSTAFNDNGAALSAGNHENGMTYRDSVITSGGM